MGLKIVKTSSLIPENTVDNKYFEKYLDTDSDWIMKRTGIENRRISKDKDASDYIEELVLNLDFSEEEKSKIDIVIVTSLSSDYLMPSLASRAAGFLKLRENVFTMDMNMACTGFAGASIMAEKFLQYGRYALIISCEILSKYTDFNNRNTAILFGDASACVLYEKTEEEMFSDYGTVFSEDLKIISKSNNKESTFIEMNGKNIYRFTMKYVPESIEKTLKKSNIKDSEIDYYILHQANIRIIEGISRRFGNIDKYYINLNRFGNTSSATIPLCLDEMNKNNLLKDKKILLSAFGGGLNYATCIISGGNI